MLTLIFGRSGSGKTRYISEKIKNDIKSGGKTLILVPERENVVYERRLTDYIGYPPNIEVINFRRLCESFFREHGGIYYNYLTEGSKKVFLWDILEKNKDKYKSFANSDFSDEKIIADFSSFIKDMKRYGVSHDDLKKAGENIKSENPALSSKLADLAIIYENYQDMLSAGHDDFDDDLTRLADMLENINEFDGYDIYFDNYYTFTPQEQKIVGLLSKQARNAYISIGYLPDETVDMAFLPIERMHKNVIKTAAEMKIKFDKPIFLYATRRFNNDELAVVENDLFSDIVNIKKSYTDNPRNIAVVKCPEPLREALYVAGDISRRIQNGARYKDICIAVNDMSVYSPVISAVFEKNGIPYYLSDRHNIAALPVVRFISSVFDVYVNHWQSDDVISMIKTGFFDISREDCDAFENFVIRHGVKGKKFYGDSVWTLTETERDEDGEKIEKLETARQRIKDSLFPLFSEFSRKNTTVKAMTAALYDFLAAQKIPEKEALAAQKAHDDGDTNKESEILQIWNGICEALDGLVLAAGDKEITAPLYKKLLFMILNEADIGTIPSYLDTVTVSECAKLKQGDIKILYVLGANEEVFPQKTISKALLTDRERLILEERGIYLDKPLDTVLAEELYVSYKTVSAPSDELVFTYSETDMYGNSENPSGVIEKLQTLFPKLKIKNYSVASPKESLYNIGAISEYITDTSDINCENAIRDILPDDEINGLFALKNIPLYSEKQEIKDKNLQNELKKRNLSYSQIEEYANCPFAYFCKYPLALKENGAIEFNALNVGLFAHKLLENTLKCALMGDSKDILEAKMRQLCKNYLYTLFGDAVTAIIEYAAGILQKTVLSAISVMVEEIKNSDYKPYGYEVKISDSSQIKALKIPLSDGGNITVNGQIDRLDAYEKDGKVYIKIVDYKTGSTLPDFQKNKKYGLDLQMILYLFAVLENGREYFNAEPRPGEMEYIQIRTPSERTAYGEHKKSADEIFKPKRYNFNERKPQEADYTPEKFAELKKEIYTTVASIAKELQSGNMQVRPLEMSKTKTACKYCPYDAVCMKKDAAQNGADTDET